MRLESMHVGMKVHHPDYGVGTVKSVSEHLADVRFDSGLRTIAPEHSDLKVADAQAELTGMTVPLNALISEVVSTMVRELGLERDDSEPQQLAARWHNGTLILRPSDAALQSKETPLDVFFHKIVMVRNNLRVLEQKINAHEKLSDAEKFEMQQYITRCYGSLTTFNLLFKDKEGQFSSKGE
ncbi:MAG TPA: hypothetical protein VGO59_17705 [Verrucomicrobiae bacterium]|jgi:hypothetical protein